MKRFKIVQAFALLFLAIGFTACDTEPVDPVLLDNIGQNPGGSTGSFTVDFNGQTYVATQSAAIYNEGMLSVNGVRISGSNIESISFVLINPVEGQTYTGDDILMAYTPSMSMFQYTNINLDEEVPSGSITITDIDLLNQTVSGTFSFTGWWSNDEEDVEPIEFTNGAFTNVSYTSGMPPGSGGEEDEFTASLDGTDYPIANIGVGVADAGAGETISINGFDTSNNKVVLTIDASLTPGTYQITGNMLEDVVGARYVTVSPESMYMATTGSIVINSKTEERIAGTYSFSATNGTDVVNFTGTYDVDYSF